MTAPYLYGETITRLRAAVVVDPYSTETTELDWTAPDTLAIPGCGVEGRGSSEPPDPDRDAETVTDFTVYAPHGADIAARDRLTIRGLLCEVVGRPFDWRSPFTGWRPGLVARANLVEG